MEIMLHSCASREYPISDQGVLNGDIGDMRAILMSIYCQVFDGNVLICVWHCCTVISAACGVEHITTFDVCWLPVWPFLVECNDS